MILLSPASEPVGKSISLCKLCGSRCLCGGIAKENAHHRGTEIAQRTTETNSPTDSEAGASIKPGVQTQGTKQKYIDSAREVGPGPTAHSLYALVLFAHYRLC